MWDERLRRYMAPELMHPLKFGLNQSRSSREGDIYAIGIVVYDIVTGVRPFGLENLGLLTNI